MRTQIILSHINELRTFFLDNNYNCVIPLRRIEKKILGRNIEYYQELRTTDGWTISIERRPWLKPFAVVEVRDENKNPLTWMGENFTGPKLILNEWSYYEHEFKLSSDYMKENNYLRIYCTNDRTQAVLCDDLSVVFY